MRKCKFIYLPFNVSKEKFFMKRKVLLKFNGRNTVCQIEKHFAEIEIHYEFSSVKYLEILF